MTTSSTPRTPSPKERTSKTSSLKISTAERLDPRWIFPDTGILTPLISKSEFSTPVSSPSPSPSSKQLNDKLSQLIAIADKARKSFSSATNMANASITIMLEALQEVEAALQSLTDMRILIDTLSHKAAKGEHTTALLKRELADLIFKYVDFFDSYEASSASGWHAWRAAMSSIVRAGKAQQEHDRVVSRLCDKATREQYKPHLNQIEGVRSVLQRMDAEMVVDLREAVDAARETLRKGLRTLNNSEKARDWVAEEIKKATDRARRSIADVSGQGNRNNAPL
ncbi:hypothetical protein BDV96DRAFT_651029 [Lophiotrema nucula]|uniref:Uncharacterized protein n=1 Tax=Lophiotrema nucula TaxID=690887 RepID=A0A6A5YTC6_9PLEO|nr:hypothetical protein BDV96DRAFT_651029 [Lophiotrema nucula]